ncbi:flagellar assembly peptidoglycan hydrolase FlgJ [Thalassotalea marina]|uniref:Peptidoglycan hydrolase FlgJ n=1 Tax=Thalassotalea marina TaxID=1673741 RepID=A0A919BCX9_9GAMM|nr:flagellar assembly peptidoglycan hydrolase FlgJ [Thalassotalea marina]GHF80249.1 peptidoglycan hydrolase FlgJ [Thalassotalea marina]
MSNRIADAQNFLDVNGLNDIRLQSKADNSVEKGQALQQAAKQFESIFMQMLLKSMRSAQEVLESDSPFNSQSTKFYRDMHDQQMALELSNNGSLGLAELIVRQLGGDSENFTPKSVFKENAIKTYGDSEQARQFNMPKYRQNTDFSIMKLGESDTEARVQFNEPKDFVTALAEPAKLVEKKLKVPYQVVIAQAALETGWGQKIIEQPNGQSSHNLFNIKADRRWDGDKTMKETLEYEQGSMVKKREPFRVYKNMMESVNDYINFLSNSDRYKDALDKSSNVEHFLQGLQKAGYATDPNYAKKIMGTLSKVTSILNE